jgi:phosphate transport system substrate-binding protein
MKKVTLLMAVLIAVFAIAGCTNPSAFDIKKPIVVVSREVGSGTRGAFIELVGLEKKNADGTTSDLTYIEAIIANGNAAVMTNVAGNQYAIGYSSFGALNNTVKALKINGVAPTEDNLKNGTYKIARPFNLATKGQLSVVAADFMAYILSTDGQKVVAANKYIASAGNAFTSSKPAGKVVLIGSTSVSPLMEKLSEAYKVVNPNAIIEIQSVGSTPGMTAAIEGTCDIGMASRALKDSEIAAGLTPTVIAIDGIAIIVNTKSTITDLTLDKVKKIFIGELKLWSDVLL